MHQLPKESFIASIVIPTHQYRQRSWMVKECLRALRRQTVSKDSFEVLVINNSPNENKKWETELLGFCNQLNLKILHEPKRGSYAARNLGARCAQGRILAFIDSDCVPKKNWLEMGVESLLKSDPKTILGGRIIKQGKSNPLNWVERHEKLFTLNQRRNIYRGGFVATANLMIVRKVFFDVGVFDDSLVASGDVEWSFRAQEKGCKLFYSSTSCVYHQVVARFLEIVQRYRRKAGGHYAVKRINPMALEGKQYNGFQAKKILSPKGFFFYSVSRLHVFIKIVQIFEMGLCKMGKSRFPN